MLKLEIAGEAEWHLIDIGEYTQDRWGLTQRAKYIKNLTDRFDWLTENPTQGKDRGYIRKGVFLTIKGSI